MKKSASGLDISTDQSTTLEADCLLWAVGRGPNVKNLGLDKAGVDVNARGHVVVDKFQNTKQKNVYALGDVAGKFELTPGM